VNKVSGCKPGTLGCKDVVDFAVDFLDRSLPESERNRFEAHLQDCPECVRFFETYRKTPEVTRDCFAVKMPSTVKNAVLNFLRTRCKD
jgi:anti-sigma factor (TIGR02949 family)